MANEENEFDAEISCIKSLIKRSSETNLQDEAIKLSQAALNAANALDRVFWLKENQKNNGNPNPIPERSAGIKSASVLPKYQCHKTVHAIKIAGVEIHEDGSATVAPDSNSLATINTDTDWASKFKGDEDELGYYVVYNNGYTSWSPTKEFEEGYSLIE